MKKNLEELTDQELLEQAKSNKSYKLYDSIIIGFLVGIALYSTVVNSFGLLTFLPIAYIPIAKKNRTKYEELKKLLKERNLELKT